MEELVERILALPEGPQLEILERLPGSFLVWVDGLTLHVDCIDLWLYGEEDDYLFILLSCHLGLVNTILFHTYNLYFNHGLSHGSRVWQVTLLAQKHFNKFLKLVNNKVQVKIDDSERAVVEAWKEGANLEEAFDQTIYNEENQRVRF